MEVEVAISEEDLVIFERYLVKAELDKNKFKFLVMFFLIMVILFGLLVFPETIDASLGFAVGLDVGVAVFVLFVFIKIRILRRQRDQFARTPQNQWLFKRQKLSISPDGISVTGQGHRSFLAWDLISKIDLASAYCFIFCTSNSAHIVPKRAFPDEITFLRFVALARQFKDGPRPPSIADAPVREMPRQSTDLFDPNSSY